MKDIYQEAGVENQAERELVPVSQNAEDTGSSPALPNMGMNGQMFSEFFSLPSQIYKLVLTKPDY